MILIDWWLLAATCAATLCTLTFVIRYALTMRWERTATGRSIMTLALALTIAEAAAVTRRIDELTPSVDLNTATTIIAAIGWTAVTGVFAWRHWALTHPVDGPDDDSTSR